MKEKMTTVLLPRGRKQEETFVIVSVNGRSWKIMRGVAALTAAFTAGADDPSAPASRSLS